MRYALLLLLPLTASAQLILSGPVPKSPNPPVVFLNGYQAQCFTNSFSGTFGNADKVMQANQTVSLFFNNCDYSGKPTIEELGQDLGQFLAALKYTDGTPVTQVDVVAHSMGGLIVRSYLAGKQPGTTATFRPPATTPIRKLVFLATPHFGSNAVSYFGIDRQSQELATGSQFLFDLNTWNDGTDDLRGIDALAIVGNGGTGLQSGVPAFDDGLVTLSSQSIEFARPGRTRVVLACHAAEDFLSLFGLCKSSAPLIAKLPDANSDVARIVLSFLAGTNAWQSLGQPIGDNLLASTLGGINLIAEDANGLPQTITSASLSWLGQNLNLSLNNNKVAYADAIPAKIVGVAQVKTAASQASTSVTHVAATVLPRIVKQGPVIDRALPAGGNVFPLNVAPGEFVAIYGSNLASTTQAATTSPWPLQISDVQVTVNGTPARIGYISPTQINVLYPDIAPTFTQITVSNIYGKHTINLLMATSVPSVFTLDGSGTGPAAATNGIDGQIVTPAAPLHKGDYLALYLTGLGQTTNRNGLDYAQNQPTITIGNLNCPVTYAGRAPTLQGIDQINCRIPDTITTGTNTLTVTVNNRLSNATTLVIQ